VVTIDGRLVVRNYVAAGLVVVAVMSHGCASTRFEAVVRKAANERPGSCGREVVLERLTDWSFRVQGCDGTLYYRCYYDRRTSGRMECCYEVPNERAATERFSIEPWEKTCERSQD
jgi:hypothetical protein